MLCNSELVRANVPGGSRDEVGWNARVEVVRMNLKWEDSN